MNIDISKTYYINIGDIEAKLSHEEVTELYNKLKAVLVDDYSKLGIQSGIREIYGPPPKQQPFCQWGSTC